MKDLSTNKALFGKTKKKEGACLTKRERKELEYGAKRKYTLYKPCIMKDVYFYNENNSPFLA